VLLVNSIVPAAMEHAASFRVFMLVPFRLDDVIATLTNSSALRISSVPMSATEDVLISSTRSSGTPGVVTKSLLFLPLDAADENDNIEDKDSSSSDLICSIDILAVDVSVDDPGSDIMGEGE
jgi:hypothetical protein